ncbi:MAG: FeoB small GTPase domain-containing protein [Halanaerobiales bacterium]
MNVLLFGNPNVGKSVVFSRLTGTSVTSSNYPGTTVEYTEGYLQWGKELIHIIDVPGIYTLNPTNKAEEVAVSMLDKGDVIVNVVDSTNLERNLNLTLQLLERDIPVIVVLNMWDETQHRGIEINLDKLEELLKVPVIPTVAVKGHGISQLINTILAYDYKEYHSHQYENDEDRWSNVGKIISEVQEIHNRRHTFHDIFDEFTIKPLTGLPFAIIVLSLAFIFIRTIGEGIISYLTGPFFDTIYYAFVEYLSNILGGEGIIHNILLGNLINGSIDFEQSFGLLTTGIYIPLAAVAPYIISFYFMLGLLEDTGYLPRLAVLVDNIMHKVGLHGFSIIPMILGFGCNVPAALAIRSLESEREKFIASTLMVISIPCMSQLAMIFGLLGPYGGKYIGYLFMILALVWIIVGNVLNKLIPGFSTDLLLEVPPFRLPGLGTIFKKLWIRIKGFFREAIPFVMIGVFIVNILYLTGVMTVIVQYFGPALSNLFGLPRDAINALLMGFLRKDLAMGLLVPLDLTVKQLMVASIVLTVYFPCIATFSVLIKELGFINMIKSTIVMLITALLVGGFVNLVFTSEGLTINGWIIIALIILLLKNMPFKRLGTKIDFTDT